MALREGALVLADGSVFEGELIGAEAPGGVATGEVVFNTVLSGYQEVITDPSYAGQIIAFTNPHIGNYGVSTADFESRRPFCRGVVVRELARRRSSWRSDGDLDDLLRRYGISGIAGIDTRRLTRLIRETGALPGAFGDAGEAALRAAAAAEPGTDGHRPGGRGDDEPALRGQRGWALPDRRLRPRHQADDPAPAGGPGHGRGGAGVHRGGRRPRP